MQESATDDKNGAAASRRRFLAGAIGLTSATVATSMFTGSKAALAKGSDPSTAEDASSGAEPDAAAASTPSSGDRRSYTAPTFAFELNGKPVGLLGSAAGGDITADVVAGEDDASYYEKKHLGSRRYEDLLLQIGNGMRRSVYDWISASWAGSGPYASPGAVVYADYNYKARRRAEFSNALLTETTIPALDALTRDVLYFGLRITPELIRHVDAGGEDIRTVDFKQKGVLLNSFRLEIPGLDCTKVERIEALTIRQTWASPGSIRESKSPFIVHFPNLVVTLSAGSTATWAAWHDDFVVRLNSGDDQEKVGRLQLLASDLRDVVAEVRFYGLGIFKMAPDGADAGRVRAEMYCERMQFLHASQPEAFDGPWVTN